MLAAAVVDTPTDVPTPGALGEDAMTVGTGSGGILLERVQPEGKAPMSWRDFANGSRPQPGETFDSVPADG